MTSGNSEGWDAHLIDRGGSHEIWVNPANNNQTTVPRHANRDLATGTVQGIRRDLGISRQEFDRA